MKVDLKTRIPAYRARAGVFALVDVPPLRYLAIDGSGDPNTSAAYAQAVSTLFAVAYRLKFTSKRELDRDYVVMPLEAQWWSDDMAAFTVERDASRWSWTALNLLPDWIGDAEVDSALSSADASSVPARSRLRIQTISEGRCAQTLHIGPYDEEGPVLRELHEEYIPAHGFVMTGLHHEIYLSDARRTDPAKLRTILRQPVVEV
ncbi:MAG: 2-C-methyl-D-erythritol 2,4-cyclodiphosphate synthase [Microbacterium sp.]|nr:2-C-methyl-D-erythritol 2,4-cyclodiphosphate synthase [Microbacterium sp.]